MVSEKFSFKNSQFTKNVLLINFFVTQLFRSFRWLIFPSILLSKSWKLHKLLKLISSFNFWIIVVRIYGHGFYELSRILMRKNVNDNYWKVSLWDVLTPFPCTLQAHFFCKIQQNGYKVLYLSARAIGQVRTSLAVSFKNRPERARQTASARARMSARVRGMRRSLSTEKGGNFFSSLLQ